MKKKYNITKILPLLLCLVSCSTDEGIDSSKVEIPIVLTCERQSSESTRASFTQDTQFLSGQLLYVWGKRTNTSTDHLKTWILRANGSGGFTTNTANNPKYYPSDGTNIDIYALHGNITSPSLSENGQSLPTESNAITHAVISDQTTDANYAKSDLLASRVTNKGPHGNANVGNNYTVPMSFNHLLCRIEVLITSPDLSASDITSIKLLNPKTTTTLTMPTYANANPTIGTTNSATVSAITMHFNSSDHMLAECIIPQQNYANNAQMIQLTLNDGKTFVYNASQAFSFVNGKSYRFEMTFDRAKIVAFGVGVTDWTWSNSTINMEYIKLTTADDTSAAIDAATADSQNIDWEFGGENSKENTKGNEWF